MLTLIKKPSKERVRQYLGLWVLEHAAPPSLQEIRRRLGWEMIEAERSKKAKR